MATDVRILLTGKHGQVGFELMRALAPLGDLIAIDQPECDLTNAGAVSAQLEALRPDIIVNPAAYTAVDKAEAEPEVAFAVNATAPGILAEWAGNNGALLVHYSTDYVFDGQKADAYTEVDKPNPLSVYGKSKLAGEEAISSTAPRHLIFRTGWVVGAHGDNFTKKMLQLASKRDQLSIVADQFGAPTSAALIADVTALLLREAIMTPGTFPYGLYHLTASGQTNWYEYARHVILRAKACDSPLQMDSSALHPIATADYPTPARRPLNSRLATNRLVDTFGLTLPDWHDGLDHILDQLLRTS